MSRGGPCQYTETENTQTKRKHQHLEELFELLKSLPDKDASEILGRIRAGVEPREIIEAVSHGNMLVHFAAANGSSRDSAGSSIGGYEDRSRGGSGENEKPRSKSHTPTKEES